MKSISVVMPSYGHNKYLPAAIKAILFQPVPVKELIIIDDASTDGSYETALGFKGFNTQVLRNSDNQGVNYSLNRGIAKCSGDLLFCPSADDLIKSSLFYYSLKFFELHPQAGLCSTLAAFIDEDGKETPYRTPIVSKTPRYFTPKECVELFVKHGSWITAQSVIFRTDAVRKLGGYDPHLGHLSDGFLINTIACKYGALFIPEVMAYWRRTPSSGGLRISDNLPDSLLALNRMELKMRLHGMPEKFLMRYRNDGRNLLLEETIKRNPEMFPAPVRAAAKAYLFSKKPLRSKLRTIGMKLKIWDYHDQH